MARKDITPFDMKRLRAWAQDNPDKSAAREFRKQVEKAYVLHFVNYRSLVMSRDKASNEESRQRVDRNLRETAHRELTGEFGGALATLIETHEQEKQATSTEGYMKSLLAPRENENPLVTRNRLLEQQVSLLTEWTGFDGKKDRDSRRLTSALDDAAARGDAQRLMTLAAFVRARAPEFETKLNTALKAFNVPEEILARQERCNRDEIELRAAGAMLDAFRGTNRPEIADRFQGELYTGEKAVVEAEHGPEGWDALWRKRREEACSLAAKRDDKRRVDQLEDADFEEVIAENARPIATEVRAEDLAAAAAAQQTAGEADDAGRRAVNASEATGQDTPPAAA